MANQDLKCLGIGISRHGDDYDYDYEDEGDGDDDYEQNHDQDGGSAGLDFGAFFGQQSVLMPDRSVFGRAPEVVQQAEEVARVCTSSYHWWRMPPASDREQKAAKYQWVLFDADGTVFDYDRAERAALARVFQVNGVAFDPAFVAAYREINQKLWLDLERRLVTPDTLKVRRFEILLRHLGVDRPAADFSDLYLECLADCSELIEGAREVLEGLRTQCRIAIVTNGLQAVQRRRVERSVIYRWISELIISEEIGHAKPAPEFFDVVFGRLGHPPRRQVLMVGDSWSSDIQGAADYGLDTCWYNPARRPRPTHPAITYEIGSLLELLGSVTGLDRSAV